MWYTNRWFRLVIWCFATLFTTCIYYGWQQFSLMLLDSGAYSWLCDIDEPRCDAQVKQIQVFFAIATGTEYLGSVVAGVALDAVGPRVCGAIGEAMWLFGALLQYFSSERFPAYLAAAFFWGASVNMVAYSTLTLEEYFPGRENLMLSLIVAMQTFSGAIAPLAYMLTKSTTITAKSILGFYLPAIWLPVSVLLILTLPSERPSVTVRKARVAEKARRDAEFDAAIDAVGRRRSSASGSETLASMSEIGDMDYEAVAIEAEPRAVMEDIETGSSSSSSSCAPAGESEAPASHVSKGDQLVQPPKVREVNPSFSCKGFVDELLTPEWILFCIYYQFAIAGYNYYHTTVQSRWDDEMAVYVGWLIVAQAPLALGLGVLSLKTTTLPICIGLAVSMLINYACLNIPSMSVQYGTAALLVLSQSWIWTTKYCYCSEVFAKTNFGKLVGVMGAISGIVTYLNPLILASNADTVWVVLFSVSSFVGVLLLCFLFYRFWFKKIIHKQYESVDDFPSRARSRVSRVASVLTYRDDFDE